MNLKHQPNMDNPEDNYRFEFHAKKPENDKKHWWFKVGDILELESVWDYEQEHGLKGDELKLLEKLNKAFCTESSFHILKKQKKILIKF
nr:hypothetical protein [Helicobacter pylori]